MPAVYRILNQLKEMDDVSALCIVGNDGKALTWDNGTSAFEMTALVTDHGVLTGLSDDDHTGYVLLAGRAGGQTLYGDTAANGDLVLHGTSNATRTTSYVLLQPTAGNVGIGTTTPDSLLHASLTDTGTNTAAQVVTISHNGGTPAAGFGSKIKWEGKSSTTEDREMAALDVAWSDATDATRTSYVNLQTVIAGTVTRILHTYKDATATGRNIFVGQSAGNLTMSPSGGSADLSSYNSGFGYTSLDALTTGYFNQGFGYGSLTGVTEGIYNTGAGAFAGQTITTGDYHTAVGAYALAATTTANNSIGIGFAAGRHETASYKLFIDAIERSTEAAGRTDSIIYGVMSATPASQTLALNASVTSTYGHNVPTGYSIQIGGTAARATTAGTNRLDIFDGTAPVGTLANGVSIYSTSGECYIMDASGNATLQSPHDLDTGEWIFWSRNTVTGRTYRVDMERMVAAIEALTGQSFTTETFESLN